MKTNLPDFSVPQRQSPAAIIILLLKSAISVFKAFWPALLIIVMRTGKESETPKGLIAIIIFGALTIVFTLIRFLYFYFHIQNENLIIQTGWLKKKTLSIPLKSIQAVHLEQNVWQQALSVSKMSIDTAGSEKIEASFDALDVKKAEQLKYLLLSHADEHVTITSSEEEKAASLYSLNLINLVKLSLSANHLEAFFILLALSLNLVENIKEVFKIDSWKWMENWGGSIGNHMTLTVSIIIIFVAIISVVYSIFRTLIRYYNFSLQTSFQRWKVSFGLFTRQERIIPHKKIQVYSWHATWLRRKINFWMLDIKTIGQKNSRERQKVKIPFTNINSPIQFAVAYQNSAVAIPHDGLMIDPGYWNQMSWYKALPVTLVLVLIAAIWLQWQSLWIGLIFFYFLIRNYQWYKNYRWYVNEEGLQLYSGFWGRRYTLLRWNKVHKVTLSQSPYQSKRQLASLKFITAGGVVELPFIDLDMAKEVMNMALYLVESKNENWI